MGKLLEPASGSLIHCVLGSVDWSSGSVSLSWHHPAAGVYAMADRQSFFTVPENEGHDLDSTCLNFFGGREPWHFPCMLCTFDSASKCEPLFHPKLQGKWNKIGRICLEVAKVVLKKPIGF